MAKRVRLKWAPRVRQPRRPVTRLITSPRNPIFGPIADETEIHNRLVHRKAF